MRNLKYCVKIFYVEGNSLVIQHPFHLQIVGCSASLIRQVNERERQARLDQGKEEPFENKPFCTHRIVGFEIGKEDVDVPADKQYY